MTGPSAWIGIGVTVALLVNAVLTLIAGTRLWAHIFWRPNSVERRAPLVTQPVSPRREHVGFGAVCVLVVGIVIAGLWPAPLMDGANVGAAGMVDPSHYVDATNLAEATP